MSDKQIARLLPIVAGLLIFFLILAIGRPDNGREFNPQSKVWLDK